MQEGREGVAITVPLRTASIPTFTQQEGRN